MKIEYRLSWNEFPQYPLDQITSGNTLEDCFDKIIRNPENHFGYDTLKIYGPGGMIKYNVINDPSGKIIKIEGINENI